MNAAMPTYFIPHGGGPCFFMDWSTTGDPADTWDATAAWLRGLANTLADAPRSILVISGHWEEPVFTASSGGSPSLIYDYSGFPPHTYHLQYPAPGAPALAQRIVELLIAAGLPAKAAPQRGLDHGVFIPLLLMYPQADMPVVSLSLRQQLNPAEHLAAGRALRSLRDEGVLIVGSGMSYHNMRGFRSAGAQTQSEIFDQWLTETIGTTNPAERWNALARWADAPSAHYAHPRAEHLLPLMVAAGAAADAPGQRVFTDQVMNARISGYRFG